MQLENINCPICASIEQKLIFRSRDFRFKKSEQEFNVVKCINCGFIFLNPRPIQKNTAGLYPEVFYYSTYSVYYKIFSLFFEFNQRSVSRFLKRYKKSGKLLDIGCGTGHFIAEMQKNGYDVYGVEVSENAKNFIPESLKNRIYDRNLEDCGFAANTFDIITMFQSLEHVHNLDRLLEEARRLLKPDGVMYLSVPNSGFIEYRLFRPYAYTLDVPRHLYFFTKQTLQKLLLKKGFVIDSCLRNIIGELFITPMSFYHGFWNHLEDKLMFRNRLIKLPSFIPLFIVGVLTHILFISEPHVLEVSCRKYP